MVRANPSIVTALCWAYWDLARCLRVLWRPSLIAFAILCAGILAALIAPVRLADGPVGQELMRLAFLAAVCFLLTPYLLAIHRFVILGETAPRYKFEISSERFQLYCGWLVVIIVLFNIPSVLEALTTPRGVIYYVGAPLGFAEPSIMVKLTSLVRFPIIECLLVLFPALAIDAPGAAWQNAIRDTCQRIGFALFLVVLSLAPVGFLAYAASPLLRIAPKSFAGLLAILFLGAMFLLLSLLSAVVASRLYQIIGDRLNRPRPDS